MREILPPQNRSTCTKFCGIAFKVTCNTLRIVCMVDILLESIFSSTLLILDLCSIIRHYVGPFLIHQERIMCRYEDSGALVSWMDRVFVFTEEDKGWRPIRDKPISAKIQYPPGNMTHS